MSAEGGPETAGFQAGAFVSPLTASTANALIVDADPALKLLLDFFANMISIHLGARWNAEVSRSTVGRSDLSGHIVSTQIPYDPLPFLQSAQLAPPLIALYPVSDDLSEEHTRHWYKITGTLRLMWILPPLTAAQFLQLYPFLRAAAKVIKDRTEQGYDPNYSGGQLDASNAIMEINLGRATYGTIPQLKTDMHFPCVAIDMQVTERRMSAPNIGDLAGIDDTVQVQPQDDTAVTLITAKVDL